MKIHVKIEDKTYEVTVGDLQARPVIASVDGEDFEVWPEEMSIPVDPFTAPTIMPAAPAAASQMSQPEGGKSSSTKKVRAPLPGVIIEILVAERDSVDFGQELCVLEAMKMKNTIHANRAGRIKSIHVNTGDQVQHNTVLLEFED